MPPRIPSRVRSFSTAGVALFSAALLANGCSLNPQPLPPDQPTDASSGFGSPAQGATDGGVTNRPGQPDATIPAVDSGPIPVAEDSAPPTDVGAAPDAGRSSDGGAVDGEHDGSDGAEDATGDTSVAADAADATEASALEDTGAVDTDASTACTSCPAPVCGSVPGQCIDEMTCTRGCPETGGCPFQWQPEPSMGCGPGLGCCSGGIAPQPIIVPATNGPFHNDFAVTILMPAWPCAAICYTVDGTPPQCIPSTVPTQGACGVCLHGQLYDASIGVPVGVDPVTVSAVACYDALSQTITGSQKIDFQVAAPTMSQPAPGNLGTVTQGVTLSGAPCSPVNPNATPACFVAIPTLSTATNPSPSPSDVWIVYTIAPAPLPTCTTGTVVDLQTPPLANRIGIAATTTVQAIACKTGYLPSEVVTFPYVVGSSVDGGP